MRPIDAFILSFFCMECGVFIVGCLFKGDQSLGIKVEKTASLLGGLLPLLLLLLGIGILLRLSLNLLNGSGLLDLGLLLDGDEQANDVLGLEHVVLIDLELTAQPVSTTENPYQEVLIRRAERRKAQKRTAEEGALTNKWRWDVELMAQDYEKQNFDRNAPL